MTYMGGRYFRDAEHIAKTVPDHLQDTAAGIEGARQLLREIAPEVPARLSNAAKQADTLLASAANSALDAEGKVRHFDKELGRLLERTDDGGS